MQVPPAAEARPSTAAETLGCLQRPPPPLPPRPRGVERPGQGYGQEPSESEAGPQAVQAAEQARQAFGRGRGGIDGRGIVSVESLMDEIIDRAYDEDDEMGVGLPVDAWQQSRSSPLLSASAQALSKRALCPACLLPACSHLLEMAVVRVALAVSQRVLCSMYRATAAAGPLAQRMKTWTPKMRRLTWARWGHSLTICQMCCGACTDHLMKAASPSPAPKSGQHVNPTHAC